MAASDGLSDAEWAIWEPFFPPERGRVGQPAKVPTRLFLRCPALDHGRGRTLAGPAREVVVAAVPAQPVLAIAASEPVVPAAALDLFVAILGVDLVIVVVATRTVVVAPAMLAVAVLDLVLLAVLALPGLAISPRPLPVGTVLGLALLLPGGITLVIAGVQWGVNVAHRDSRFDGPRLRTKKHESLLRPANDLGCLRAAPNAAVAPAFVAGLPGPDRRPIAATLDYFARCLSKKTAISPKTSLVSGAVSSRR